MKTMNEVVTERIGQLSISLCEAEVMLADREEAIKERDLKIVELENELLAHKRNQKRK